MVTAIARVLALAGAAVLALATPSLAHGPTRQKAVERIEINASPDKVWAVVGNFQDMGWHPAVAKTEGTGGNDVGATRKLTLKSGGTIEEKLGKYNKDSHILSYEITAVDV